MKAVVKNILENLLRPKIAYFVFEFPFEESSFRYEASFTTKQAKQR